MCQRFLLQPQGHAVLEVKLVLHLLLLDHINDMVHDWYGSLSSAACTTEGA